MRHPEVLIALLVGGSSFLQWLFRKLREQQALNERRLADRRLREESLRTGRPVDTLAQRDAPGVAEAARRQRLIEAAARRQAQLEELRRRQADAARRSAPARAQAGPRAGSPRPPIQAAPASARRIPQGPFGSGPIVAQPSAGRAPPPKRKTPKPNAPSSGKPKPAQAQRDAPAPPSGPGTLTASLAASPAAPRAGDAPPSRAHGGIPLHGVTDWRNAVVMIEALSPPLAIRAGSALDPLGW